MRAPLMASFRIRDIVVDPPLVLAPMAGYTSSPLRRLVREGGGCGLVFSEVLAVKGILHRNRKTEELLFFHEDERPIGVQLLGSDPDEVVRAIPVVERVKPDLLDINLGCPKPKVTSKCEGGALLEDPARARAIVRAACATASVPVTVKLRLPRDPDLTRFVDFCLDLAACGAAAITLHPRTVDEGFRGRARWEILSVLSPRLHVPLIGSGDVHTAGDVRQLLAAGCAGVMIGRAAVGNPGIFGQLARELAGLPAEPPTAAERLTLCLRHLDLLGEEKGAFRATLDIRKQLTRYLRGVPHVQETVRRLITIRDFDELRGELAAMRAGLGA
jgi:tRNA-dihydrouridine synthase B